MILYVTTQVFFIVSLMLCMMNKTTSITPLDESYPKSDFQFWTFWVFTGILIKYAV